MTTDRPPDARDLARLADPTLTTEDFHHLYRSLADIDRRPYR